MYSPASKPILRDVLTIALPAVTGAFATLPNRLLRAAFIERMELSAVESMIPRAKSCLPTPFVMPLSSMLFIILSQ